ncbi:hypothetical protein DFP72DRAFT_930792 [Ephemerocybe angulata]|uniref:Uncharacterized protein n=1 Tax=Ephemerocybe angulata TaxID=980116 RepID=A0A8H6HDX9_9AGAR|nr:hypothetical protein DFP72DRAFT_930792 [Tulosesus angulatus]
MPSSSNNTAKSGAKPTRRGKVAKDQPVAPFEPTAPATTEAQEVADNTATAKKTRAPRKAKAVTAATTAAAPRARTRTSRKKADTPSAAADVEPGTSAPDTPVETGTTTQVESKEKKKEAAKLKAEELKEAARKKEEERKSAVRECWDELVREDVAHLESRKAAAPRYLDDIEESEVEQGGPEQSDGCEEIDVSNVSDCSDDSDVGVEGPAAATTSLGDHDSETKNLQDKIKQLEAKLAETKLGKSKSGTRAPQPSSTLPLASGLRKARLGIDRSRPSYQRVGSEHEPAVQVRGLEDEDTEDIPPSPGSTPRHYRTAGPAIQLEKLEGPLSRDHTRQNTDVVPIPVSRIPQKQPTAKAPKRPAVAKTAVVPRPNTHPAPPLATSAPLAKSQPSKDKNPHKIRKDDLPVFATTGQKWRSHYLPTLSHRLYCSSDPFTDFKARSDNIVKQCQAVVDAAYPEVRYTVTDGDPIVQLSYNRINERRGAIAKEALVLIQEHVKSAFETQEEAGEWLQWARRPTGPLFWEIPTPRELAALPRNHPDFIPPSGRLRSEFVISLLKDFLEPIKDSSLDQSEIPFTLVALILTALERAAAAVLPNGEVKRDILSFSDDNFGTTCRVYRRSLLSSITTDKWDEILRACAILPVPSYDGDIDMSLLDEDRATMFDFDSPRKPAYQPHY